MSEELEAAQRYRERAQELRIAAADKQHAFIRDNLLSIAATYDHLAQTLEKIDKSNKNAPTTLRDPSQGSGTLLADDR